MKKLAEIGDVFVVTACPIWKNGENIYKAKADWLDEHLPEIGSKRMIIAHDKHVIDGDILIDDAMHNVDPFLNDRDDRFAIVLHYPWNDNPNTQLCEYYGHGSIHPLNTMVWVNNWAQAVDFARKRASLA
jgi:5'(3')-deoxyribonucleotidase